MKMFEKLKTVPTHMDFEGQKKAEKIFQLIIVITAVVGFVVGFITQQFSHTVYMLGVGFLCCCFVTLPPWPMYRKHPLQWQKPVPEEGGSTSAGGDGSSSPSSSTSSGRGGSGKKQKKQ